MDLFALEESTHCPLWFSLIPSAPLVLDAMVQMWLRQRLYAFPLITLLPGVLPRVHQEGLWLILVAQFWPFLKDHLSDGLTPATLMWASVSKRVLVSSFLHDGS